MQPIIRTNGITSRELEARTDRRIIKNIITAIVHDIDAKIVNAHAAGYNTITYDLPVNFEINCFDKRDAQTFVYSEILVIYTAPEPEGRGFTNVSLALDPKPTLRITWLNGMDAAEKKSRLSIIERHLRK